MASDSPKAFIVVECQKPANGTLKRVCVPRSWVICTLIPDKMVCIVYPDEEMSRTAERLMNNEPKGEGWRSYIGEIIYEAESFLDALYGYTGISGNRNIKQHVEVTKSHEAPQTSIISPKLESSEEPPAADTESVASRPAAVTPSSVELVTPEVKARDSLKVKIRRSSYGWQSEPSEIMKKSFKKLLKEHEKQIANSFLDSINTPEATEVNQNKPGIEHIMSKRMELKIKDIMHSSEPELNRLTLNKTNSVVSNASLSENVQKDVHIKFRNLSPADKKLLVNLQNENYETVEKIRNLQLQLKELLMKVKENQEDVSQLFLKYQIPLEAVPLESNDQDSNMTDDKMETEEDNKEDNKEDDEELKALIYDEDEEKVSEEQEIESVLDTEPIQWFLPPPTPELLKKNARNNNRWTLKYKQPGKGLIQLGKSGIYLSSYGLERCKRTCDDVRTFVRELYKEVFTREALSTCSMTGQKPNVGRTKRSSPALHCEAQSVILKYALNYSHKVGWDRVKRYSLLQTIRAMLIRFKNKKNRD